MRFLKLRWRAAGVSVLSALLLPYSINARLASQVAGSGDSRAPFVMILPDLGRTVTEPEIRIPTAELGSIKFEVRQPFSDSINLGKVYVSINGESAGLIMSVNPGLRGHVVTCDLERARFHLNPGKNVVEISALDRGNRWFYASYVLRAGGRVGDDQTVASGANIDYKTVSEEQQPPEVFLLEPKGSVRSLASPTEIKVKGVVSDSSGKGVVVKVNGRAATLSPARATRGLFVHESATGTVSRSIQFDFEVAVSLTGRASNLVIEATDGLGNVTRVSLPYAGRTPAISSAFKGRKYAIIVGISQYEFHDGGLANLDYADADARAIRDYLQRPEGGGFSSGDILYLQNNEATIGAVRDGLYRFLPKAGPNDLVVVFLAGHGAPDPYAPKDLYFLMHDTKVADMSHTALPMTEFQQALDTIVRAQRVVVFVDACHSAGLTGSTLARTRGLENNLINLYASKLFKETGRAVLTSSEVNELSQESSQWGGGHGIFTLALLEGLGGAADSNGDHFVTAGELFSYVRNRVSTETGFHQNPFALPGLNADITLAAVPR